MPRKCIGALDQGTTSTRFMLFDCDGNEIIRHQQEHDQILPQSGWVEHDPMQIVERARSAINNCCSVPDLDLTAIGITNQRETTVVWNPKTGLPWYNAIVWQDTRTASIVTELEKQGLSDLLRNKTGLPLSTYFSAPKIIWILRHVPGVADAVSRGEAIFGTIDTWLIWNLTGGIQNGSHVTDVTNASRTMLMNLETLQWDDQLLEIFQVPREMLPAIRPSADGFAYGSVTDAGRRIPICGNVGDQQAALMGQVCFQPGQIKNTYGTGNFLLMNTGTQPKTSKHGLLTTCGYQIEKNKAVYALEGSVAVTGSAVQWLRDQMRMIRNASEVEPLANSVKDNGGVYFVPAFSGLFAPYWRMDARGTIAGLTRFSNAGHIARATLEAICYQTRDVVEAMREDASDISILHLKVDGGATVNDTLMQLQADILGIPVIRPVVIETTSLGAAYAAGLAAGIWKGLEELSHHWKAQKTWEPAWSEDQRGTAYNGWKKAIERSIL